MLVTPGIPEGVELSSVNVSAPAPAFVSSSALRRGTTYFAIDPENVYAGLICYETGSPVHWVPCTMQIETHTRGSSVQKYVRL